MKNNTPQVNKVRSVLSKALSAIFALCGVLAVGVVIYICVHFADALPILTFEPDEPKSRVSDMMDCVCSGDFTKAQSYMLTNPNLGMKDPDDEIAAIIWEAFLDSMSYSFSGECQPTEDGLTQKIAFQCLDITSITASLRERSQALLTQRVEEAEDVSEIYDENNEYRADVVRQMLLLAVNDALKEDAKMQTTEVSIDLKYQEGQWWIIADQELLDVLFGDVLFYSA